MLRGLVPQQSRWDSVFMRKVNEEISNLLGDPIYITSTIQNRVWKLYPNAGLTRAVFLFYTLIIFDAISRASENPDIDFEIPAPTMVFTEPPAEQPAVTKPVVKIEDKNPSKPEKKLKRGDLIPKVEETIEISDLIMDEQ